MKNVLNANDFRLGCAFVFAIVALNSGQRLSAEEDAQTAVTVFDPVLREALIQLEAVDARNNIKPSQIYSLTASMMAEARYLRKAYPSDWGTVAPVVINSLNHVSKSLPSESWVAREVGNFRAEIEKSLRSSQIR